MSPAEKTPTSDRCVYRFPYTVFNYIRAPNGTSAKEFDNTSSSSAFYPVGIGAYSCHYPCSPVLFVSLSHTLFSSMTFLYVSPQFWSYIFRWRLTSTLDDLITLSSSVFLSTRPNHRSQFSLIFSLIFATPSLALISFTCPDLLNPLVFIIIHVNIQIYMFFFLSLSQCPCVQLPTLEQV